MPFRVSARCARHDAGDVRLITFVRGAARLWAHEIDHLDGLLYLDRMRAGGRLVPYDRYTETGQTWRY